MISAADLFADLMRRPKFRAEYARLAPEFRKVARRIKRTQKSPRAAGRFGKLGASTEVLATPSAGDFTLVAVLEQTTMPIHGSTLARASALPPVRPSMLAFRLGGAA